MFNKSLASRIFSAVVAATTLFGSATAQETQPPTLPETRVEATPVLTDYFAYDDSNLTGTILDGTLFSNQPFSGYRAPTSTAGSIIAVPEQIMPQTVSTLSRDLMNDQVTLSFQDLARNSGVAQAGDTLFQDRIFIRGLEVGSRNYRKDGFLDPTYVPRDFQNVERVDILKGPSSFLYGSGDPAGIVNVITKRPIANQSFAATAYTFGSFGLNRWTLDANSNVTQSGNVLTRVNVVQEDSGSFVDFNYQNRTTINPVVTWLLSPDTTLTWYGEYHKNNSIGFQGTPAVNGDPLALPPSRFVGQPGVDGIRSNEFRQELLLNHRISDEWSFFLGGYSLFYQFPGATTSVTQNPGFLPPLSGPLFYQTQTTIPFENEQTQSMITNLVGDFYTGEVRHRTVIGMEYVYFDSNSQFISSINPFPINVNNPPTGPNPPQLPIFTADFPVFRQQRTGGYFQDVIQLNPYWVAVGGVRFDTLAFDFKRDLHLGPGTAVETEQTFNRTTPRGGLAFLPFADESLSFYYNYSQSFTPPGGGIFLGTTNGGNLLPITGQGHEAGIKAMLLPNLALNACGYRIMRFNDEFNTSAFFLQQVGEVRSQGADINLIGNITDYWNVIGNYTYADSRLFDAREGFNGQNTRNVPFNTANLWTRYNFVQTSDSMLGAGIGVYYMGQRAADLQNTLFLPGFDRWDAGLYYNRGRLSANFYFFNIFNKHYDYSSINVNQIAQGAPAGMRGQVVWVF